MPPRYRLPNPAKPVRMTVVQGAYGAHEICSWSGLGHMNSRILRESARALFTFADATVALNWIKPFVNVMGVRTNREQQIVNGRILAHFVVEFRLPSCHSISR